MPEPRVEFGAMDFFTESVILQTIAQEPQYIKDQLR